jgi:hypothetical protein
MERLTFIGACKAYSYYGETLRAGIRKLSIPVYFIAFVYLFIFFVLLDFVLDKIRRGGYDKSRRRADKPCG